MIEPLARGVDPVQLAFHALVSMGTRTQRTESPLAVALERLGVDLAHGERFTTAEAKEFASLIRATLEIVETAVPTNQPAYRTGALLDTARLAMRDLQRALTDVLAEHSHLTTTLAPVLRQLLLAVQEAEPLPPAARPAVPARFDYPTAPTDTNRPANPPASPPTLARLVSALLKSIARLQAVLPLEAAPTVDRLAAPAQTATTTAVAAPPLPAATIAVLKALVAAIGELLTQLPLAATPMPARPGSATHGVPPPGTLARCLEEAIVQLSEALPVAAPSVQVSPGEGPPQMVPGLATTVAHVVGLVHELLLGALPSQATAASASPLPIAAAALPPTSNPPVVPSALAPALTAGPPILPPLLMASLAEVIAHLQSGLPSAVLEATPLLAAARLAQLQAAAETNEPPAGGTGAPVNPLETFDAYRWGLLVALNYKTAVARPGRAPVSVTRPRCANCDRLLELTRSGELVCPSC